MTMSKISRLVLFVILNFNSLNALSAEVLSELELVDEIKKIELSAQKEKFSYLPQFIDEKLIICQIKNEKEKADCLDELLTFSTEVLTCKTDAKKKEQMAAYDAGLFQDMLAEYGKTTIPSMYEDVAIKLIEAAKSLYPHTKNFPWKLEVYNGKVLNAHAGADARIMLSSGLWSEQSTLTLDEVAAIIAHEVSHIVKDHSLALGCNAYEWGGQRMDLSLAMSIFREDFSPILTRGLVWSEMSQRFEYEADQYATKPLAEIGLSPFSMGRALEKLIPKGSGGFSSGSHPDIYARVMAADKWAEQLQSDK